jgi:type IV secretory pathway VirB2 component (pilin)
MNHLTSPGDVALAIIVIVIITYAGGMLFGRIFWNNRS